MEIIVILAAIVLIFALGVLLGIGIGTGDLDSLNQRHTDEVMALKSKAGLQQIKLDRAEETLAVLDLISPGG